MRFKKLETRKGAKRRSEIQDEVLDALNQGKIESINLVEWLAIDIPTLLHHVLTEIGLKSQVKTLYHQALKLKNEGVMKRLNGIGELLFEAFENSEDRFTIFETLVNHPSDMVRGWMAFYIATNHHLYLYDRLEMMRRFAEDSSMSVRECAWTSLRPYLVEDLTTSFQLLVPWVKDKDPNIRRCAVEATRPRGVWCKHIQTLKENPELGLTILEFVRSDSSKYVQRSVGNWLNDASKSCPDWAIDTCTRWQEESPTRETNWIIKHGLRTLNTKAIR